MPVLELNLVLWNSLCDINNASSCYDEFMHKFTPIYDFYVPTKTIKVKRIDQRKPYIDFAIKKLLIEKKNYIKSIASDL